jgi:DNA helicase-2/ATP-dependent DNA helicase PcrA
MTVHKAKGLEFPVVFVVDVENNRFPGTNRAYDGWLPQQLMRAAVARGAYRSTPEGEARLFYTALTRAERYLYVTGSQRLPGGTRQWRRSRFSLGLTHAELSEDSAGLPPGLTAAPPRQRTEESDLPTSFSEIRYYLLCPRNYQFRKRYGFSPPIPELFGFGQTVHTGIGALHQRFPNRAPSGDQAQAVAEETFHLKHVAPSRDPVNRPGPYERAKDRAAEVVREYAESYTGDFANERQVEARFEIPVRGAVIAGSIDLLLRQDAQGNVIDARVIDFKSIQGGPDPENNEQIEWTELALQVQLYALAARQVLGENTRTGAVHFLRDNTRIDVPVDQDAIEAATRNVEWAVERIVGGIFPMRPHPTKCEACDFVALCPRQPQGIPGNPPPPLLTPTGAVMVPAFRQVLPTT